MEKVKVSHRIWMRLKKGAIRISLVLYMQLFWRARSCLNFFEVNACTCLDTPTFVIGLDDSNWWIFDSFLVAIISSYPEGVLQIFWILKIRFEKVVSLADHHISVIKGKKFYPLHDTIKNQQKGEQEGKAEPHWWVEFLFAIWHLKIELSCKNVVLCYCVWSRATFTSLCFMFRVSTRWHL